MPGKNEGTSIQKVDEPKEDRAIVKIRKYLELPDVRQHFVKVLGNNEAEGYMSQVLVAVANRKELQDCDVQSIFTSALTLATLRLSVDPSVRQAYLVAKDGRCEPWVSWKGLYDMALRSGKYRHINVSPLYEGEDVEIDKITGFAKMVGAPRNKTVWAYVASFTYVPVPRGETFSKVIKMTVEEIHAHAKATNPGGYNKKDGAWQKNEESRRSMEAKTILKILLHKWGYIDPVDRAAMAKVNAEVGEEDEDGAVLLPDGSVVIPPEPEAPAEDDKPKRTRQQAAAQLGFEEDAPAPAFYHLDPKIVTRLQQIAGMTAQDATRTLKEAFEKKLIGDNLTIVQLEAFARTI